MINTIGKIGVAFSAALTVALIAGGSVVIAAGLLGASYHNSTVDSITDLQTGLVKSGISDGPVAADIAAAEVPLLIPACGDACKVGRESDSLYAGHRDKALILNFEQAGIACLALDRAVTPNASGKLSDGASMCYVGQAGERIVVKPNWNLLKQTEHGKQHARLCSSAVTIGPDRLYAPCDSDADCADYANGATCTAAASLSSDQQANAGVFVVIRHAGAAAAPAITVEKALFK